MSVNGEFTRVFAELRAILKPYAQRLTLEADTQDSFSIDGPYSHKFKKELLFAAVQIKKNYVSFYFMPIYMFPDLLRDISPGSKKRMQGKSCFNFVKVEQKLFEELSVLTENGYNQFAKEFKS